MQLKKLIVGQLSTNCYLFFNKKNNSLIIDPGDDGQYISSQIEALELKPASIILTHGHFDHALAAGELSLMYKIPIYMHPKDLFLIKDIQKSASYWLKNNSINIKIKTKDIGQFKKEEFDLEIIHTPGHSPGGISLFNKENNIIFCGDLIFEGGGIGRYDFSYSKKKQLFESIKKISKKINNKTLVLPGHGNEFLMKDFK